jgi:hypothetical protein
VPVHRGLGGDWQDVAYRADKRGQPRVVRMVYEVATFQALRDQLRCKEIWVVGADRWRNPDEDLPADFAERREQNYRELRKPLDPAVFVEELRKQMRTELAALNAGPTSSGPPRRYPAASARQRVRGDDGPGQVAVAGLGARQPGRPRRRAMPPARWAQPPQLPAVAVPVDVPEPPPVEELPVLADAGRGDPGLTAGHGHDLPELFGV